MTFYMMGVKIIEYWISEVYISTLEGPLHINKQGIQSLNDKATGEEGRDEYLDVQK